jgi:tRNA(fMet)-specific endonuclease VapC
LNAANSIARIFYIDKAVSLSIITASELLHGVHRATTDDIRRRRSQFVESLLGSFTLLPVDLAVTRKHAELSATLGAAGKPVEAHDLFIAPTALAYGNKIISRDARSFPNIPRTFI